ncbi:formin-like protein 5 [Drosophila elegans]|uniref:formin-like protein 5 n=1 Tax=Drosophila elegans TaxID=30023 RepID=UPI001BC86973|nr:formin-like protein 5 [Drosophila elegans]
MVQVFPNKIVIMSARENNTQQRVEHEVREERAREQPVAKWRRDSDSVLQLLASPLVSRSPSPEQPPQPPLSAPQSPPAAQPPSVTQPPLPPPRSPTPPPPPPPRSPSPLPHSPSPPPWSPPRQQEWHLPQAQVAQALRTIVVEGRRCHQQTVTWTWPAPEVAAEEARMREAIEAIEWRRPPPLNPGHPRAKSAKRDAETADRAGLEVTTEKEREAQEGLEGPWEWPTPPETSRDTAPPPEAGAADFVPGVASPTGEADAAETAVEGRGTVGGGSGGGVAGAGGRRSAKTAREAEEGQVGQARAGGGTALPSQGSRGPGAGV